MRATRLTQISAVAAAAALLAGCGGSERLSRSEYESKLQAEGRQLKAAFTGVDFGHVSNLDEFSSNVTDLRRKIDASADDLAGLAPPAEAERDNEKIVAGLRRFSDKFGEIAAAARAGDVQRVDEIGSQIEPITNRIDAATQDLADKGYDTGEFGND